MSVRRVVALVQAADERQLVLRYRPPEGYDATRFQRSIERNGATVRRDGSVLVVSVPGVSEAAADRMVALATHGGLEFREALEDASLATVPSDRRGGEADVAPDVRLEIDLWRPEDGGGQHRVPFLAADHREPLARAYGVTQPSPRDRLSGRRGAAQRGRGHDLLDPPESVV